MSGLISLERVALWAILAETGLLGSDLERLLDAPVVTRENTGGGFFTTLAIPHPRPGETLHLGEHVWMGVEGLEVGLGMILHLYEDRQPLLEGYAVGIEDTSPIDFDQVRFAIIPEPGPFPANGN